MSNEKRCDRCEKSPAFAVTVGVVIESVVVPDQPTGHSEVADACDGCNGDVAEALFKHVVDQLTEQIPLHREIARKAAERDEVQRVFNTEVVPLVRSLVDVEEKKWPEGLAAKRDRLVKEIAAHEDERTGMLNAAAEKSDKRKAALRKALKAKP